MCCERKLLTTWPWLNIHLLYFWSGAAKTKRHQSFHLQECSRLTWYGWSCCSQMSRLLTRTIISMLRAQATEVFWGTRQARQLKGSSAHIYQVGKVLVHVESPSDRGVLVQGPKTNRRQGGCALLCSALSLLCYTSSFLSSQTYGICIYTMNLCPVLPKKYEWTIIFLSHSFADTVKARPAHLLCLHHKAEGLHILVQCRRQKQRTHMVLPRDQRRGKLHNRHHIEEAEQDRPTIMIGMPDFMIINRVSIQCSCCMFCCFHHYTFGSLQDPRLQTHYMCKYI